MKLFLSLISCLFICLITFAQKTDSTSLKADLYKKYREDQFYIGATYNVLNNRLNNQSQNGFSGGFHFGFIRDMPINKKRTYAVGLGIGLSFNSYNQNLGIFKADDKIKFDVLNGSDINVSKNTFYTNLIEVPLELRWRGSTATSYKFWRIYTGVKFGYLFSNGSKLESNQGNFNLKNSDTFNKIRYGLTLSTGYNTWNFHVYYGLNGFFDGQETTSGESIALSEIKVGLLFYLL